MRLLDVDKFARKKRKIDLRLRVANCMRYARAIERIMPA
jgi:hypothetical protein